MVCAILEQKYDRRKRRPSEAGWAFNPSLTTSKAPVKLEPSASFIAGSTKCLVSSGVHFSGTLKAPALAAKDEQTLQRGERKNVFRAHPTTPRVLRVRVDSPPRIREDSR